MVALSPSRVKDPNYGPKKSSSCSRAPPEYQPIHKTLDITKKLIYEFSFSHAILKPSLLEVWDLIYRDSLSYTHNLYNLWDSVLSTPISW